LVDGEEYTVRLARMDDVGTAYIQAARLIIVQSAPTITDTVTQVEVGNNDTTAVAAYELLTDHKIYQWDEDKFSGNVSVYFEATLKGSDAAAVSYAALSSDSCSSQVSNSEVSVTDVTWDRQRSSALSLIDDTTYYVCVHTTAADTGSIATAKIIIEQTTDTRGLTDIEMVHQYVNTSNTETSDTYVERDFDNEFNPDNWSGGTFGYYFESTAKTASGTTGYAKLKDVDNTDEIDNATTSELNATTASYARYRSSDLASNTDWPSAAADLDTIMKETASSTVSVSSSSLIIQASGLPGGVKIDDDGDPAGMSGAGRQVVRTSDGDLYAVIRDGSYIEVWKSEDGGANWEEQDSDHKEACYNVSDVAIAIDSTGTIHIYYQTSSTVHKYTSFSTSGGTFSGSTTTLYTANTTANDGAIAVDSNDKVHVVMTSDNSVGIETLDVNVKYTNNVSGWKTPVTVETKASSGTIPFSKGDIVINEDDVPEVSYCNKFQVNVGELTAAEGDANNAASFTVHDIDSDVNITSDQTSTSIAIDSVGNTWVAYVDEDGADNDGTDDNVTLAWHADSQADWTLSWTTDLTNSNVGYEPSIAVLDEDIYVFYQDYDNNHIVYDKYDANATTWGGETILRAAIGGVTYQDAKAKYSSLNNFYGPKIDFLYSDGTDIYWDQLDVAGHINDDSGFDETVEAGRQIVRLSDGTLYAVVNDSGSVEVWKSADGSSWSQQDSIDSPACANTEPVTVAVDSSNVLHLAYLDSNSPADIDYVTFTTSTSQFGTAENVVDITGAGDLVYSLSLVLDDNDIPHIVYGFEDNDSTDSVEYRNRVGGAPWGSATVESGFLSYWTDITISEDNIPEIVYINSTDDDLTAAVGNQNDATTFGTPYDTDATVNDTANQRGCSIGIDSSGNTWIAYVDSDSSITVVEHLDASAWTSWETAVTNSNVGYEPSIAIDSTDIYVIYEDDNDDIVYDKYDGSDWSGETVLETGTFQDVKARWSYLNSYDSSGTARVQTNTYYFDGSDVPALDGDGYWVGETNADDGDVDTFATSINASTVTIGELKIEGTNGTDQGTISSVKARVYGSETGTNTVINAAIYTDGGPGSGTLLGTPTKDGTEGWGSLATLSAPGGTWDWSEVQALEVYVYITSDGSPIVTMSKVEILVESTNDTAQTEFDYLFSDDTDAYYNYFVPSAAGGTAGSQDAIDSLVVSGLTKNLSLVVGSNNDLHLIYMADLDTDEVVYRRRDASTGWDVLATTIDASGTNAYLTLSINTNDTNLNDLYAIWIDTSDNHIYYEKCDVSEAGSECSTATDWAQTDWKNPGSDTYTNVTSNFSGDEHVFAMWTIDSIAPYHVSWSYIVVPEYLLMFVLFAPLFPGLFKYAKKRWAPGFLPSGA
ncbi:hypothetical protein KKB83_05150, partial [Patescibacteria group bacterium]|nr:hypothetical protein [Patescibacteria group bacterium]